ncbi:hypothetical protein B0H15DRAFT_958459 [Mycena belliarum]|uniref:Uncharacterized protein n=1 Tax=Mycena belliarum TaxID=1033014 RepID=A0AAD6TKY2_9AGAR|nr:hypothetical protein B0H15DRAFT_958459 [Mycena belliae]
MQKTSEAELDRPRESAIEGAFEQMVASPGSVQTSLRISHIWRHFSSLAVGEADAVLSLKLTRQSIMQTTCIVWTWLDNYCVQLIRAAFDEAAPETWIGRLAKHVHMLMSTRATSRSLTSADFGLPELEGVYELRQRRTLDLDVPEKLVIAVVVKIIASWLHFPTKTNSRAQAWFVDTMAGACHPATLFLDSVCFAFGHLEFDIFGDRNAMISAPSTFAPLADALSHSVLCDKKSEEFALMLSLQEMLTHYRNRTIVRISSPHPQLRTSPQDSRQLRFMDLFLGYLLELEPLISGYATIQNPTVFQATVNGKRDFLLPFREHGPSRARSRLAGNSFDPLFSRTLGGLLSGLIFRGVIFSTPFSMQAQTFFATPAAWTTEYAKFTSHPPEFFCNLSAYGRRKSNRGIHLIDAYWDAINTPGCPDWVENTRDGNYSFAECFNFLKASNPSRFKEIGALIAFLLTADFAYAAAVKMPSANTVGSIIRDINAGGMKGLELLELIMPREKGKGSTRLKGDTPEVQAAFSRLYRFLSCKLPAASKEQMVFDTIMVENSLCKLTRWHALKLVTLAFSTI